MFIPTVFNYLLKIIFVAFIDIVFIVFSVLFFLSVTDNTVTEFFMGLFLLAHDFSHVCLCAGCCI